MTDDELKLIFESCSTLTVAQLDELIQALGAIRAQAQPAVQMMPNELVPATEDTAAQFGIRSNGCLMLNLRSPAFGWQVFLLSNKNTAAIGKHFRDTAGTAWKEENITVHDVRSFNS